MHPILEYIIVNFSAYIRKLDLRDIECYQLQIINEKGNPINVYINLGKSNFKIEEFEIPRQIWVNLTNNSELAFQDWVRLISA